jgi:putative ABC transport system permease protein
MPTQRTESAFNRLFHRSQVNQELEAEIRAHLAIDISERIAAGATPEQARYAALREFGNVSLIEEVTRQTWGFAWLPSIAQDFRFALRSLFKSPAFSILAIVALAIGIGATAAIFTVVDGVLLRPLSFPEPDRLMTVWERPPDSHDQSVVAPFNFWAWQESNHSFESMAAYQELPLNVAGGSEPEQVTGVAATSDFFRVLRVTPLLGRTFAPGEDKPGGPDVVILSYGVWRERFAGRADILGQAISINAAPHQIIGVLRPGLAFPSREDKLFIPLRMNIEEGRNYSVVARLRAGRDVRGAQADVASIMVRTALERPNLNPRWSASVVPLQEQMVGDTRPVLLVLFLAVGFVLLIACANVANLLLVRGAGRSREMSVRLALGAGRGRLLQQLTVEGIALSLLGGALGALLAAAGVHLLITTLPPSFPLPRSGEIHVNIAVLLFTASVSTLAGIAFGMAPAWQSRRLELNRSLHESSRAVVSSNRLRRLLVVVEVALALVLAAGAGLMVQSFVRLNGVNPGFNPQNLLTVRMMLLPSKDEARQAQTVNAILERVRELPGVIAAGSISVLPMQGFNSWTWCFRADRPEPRRGEAPTGDISGITPGYFRAMAIPLLRGRDFNSSDRGGARPVGIINETAARAFYPHEDPIGKRLQVFWNGIEPVEIVGVSADIRHGDLKTEPRTTVFLSNDQVPSTIAAIVVRTAGDTRPFVSLVRKAIHQVDPGQGTAGIASMENLIADSIDRPRVQAWLLGLLAGIALALACIGIYGVISYGVSQRSREIGVRVALGARRKTIFALVLRDGLTMTLAGLAIGLAAALALTRFLKSLLYQVEPTDPAVLAGGCALILLVAAIACCAPALRAMRIDPASVLRQE